MMILFLCSCIINFLFVSGGLSGEAREAVLQLEEELISGDLEIPVYFAEVLNAMQSPIKTLAVSRMKIKSYEKYH